MRKKELKLVITFHTTADAMEMERVAKKYDAPGRMIPVPRVISAGCGLAWCADPADREVLSRVMTEAGLQEEAMHEVII